MVLSGWELGSMDTNPGQDPLHKANFFLREKMAEFKRTKEDEVIEELIRLESRDTSKTQRVVAWLQQGGLFIGTQSGTVLTFRASISIIERLCGDDFPEIRRIELSRPLHQER